MSKFRSKMKNFLKVAKLNILSNFDDIEFEKNRGIKVFEARIIYEGDCYEKFMEIKIIC